MASPTGLDTISGIHHVTAITADAQRNLDFSVWACSASGSSK